MEDQCHSGSGEIQSGSGDIQSGSVSAATASEVSPSLSLLDPAEGGTLVSEGQAQSERLMSQCLPHCKGKQP